MAKSPGHGFFVGDVPYAVWDWDIPQRNLEFVRGIEHEYFDYVATTHSQNLRGEQRHLAALSIRAAYFHGVETLLTLICAAIQAPRCVPAWIQRCSTPQLRKIIEPMSKGWCVLPNPLKINPISWDAIAEKIISLSDVEQEELAEVRSDFASLWARLASDWLAQISINEYNSIKHGLRVRPGGFSMAVGIEHEYGVEPPPEEMQFMGGSDFGTSFFHAEPVDNAADTSRTHFRLRRHHTNWNPESLCQALALISMSLGNVKGFLRIQNGDKPADVRVWRAQHKEAYWEPWQRSPGVTSSSMDTIVAEEHIERLSKDELAERIRENYK